MNDPAESDPGDDRNDVPNPEVVATRLRERGECVRRRELETALRRLDVRGDVTPGERRVVARLSAGLTDALVERWISNPVDESASGDVNPDAALDLLVE